MRIFFDPRSMNGKPDDLHLIMILESDVCSYCNYPDSFLAAAMSCDPGLAQAEGIIFTRSTAQRCADAATVLAAGRYATDACNLSIALELDGVR